MREEFTQENRVLWKRIQELLPRFRQKLAEEAENESYVADEDTLDTAFWKNIHP